MPQHRLELIHRSPRRLRQRPKLVFVHGAYAGAWCWDVHFLPYFAGQGYAALALSLRGHGASPCDGALCAAGLDDYVDDVAHVLATLDEPVVLVGHSMGALIVTRYLARVARNARHRLAGAILMAPVPCVGLTPVTLGLALRSPQLLAELNLVQYGRPSYDRLTNVRRALFSQHLDETTVRSYFARMQPESTRAIMEMSLLHLSVADPQPTIPLLVLGAENDGLFAPEFVHGTAHTLGARCEIVPDIAHTMMLDPGWMGVSERMCAWIARVEAQSGSKV